MRTIAINIILSSIFFILPIKLLLSQASLEPSSKVNNLPFSYEIYNPDKLNSINTQVFQSGNDNISYIYQGPVQTIVNNSHFWIRQKGDGNEALILQNSLGAYSTEVSIEQYGSRNEASTSITNNPSNPTTKNLSTKIFQKGHGNFAMQNQEGFLPMAQEQQNIGYGDRDASLYFSGGGSGYLFIEQIGDFNSALHKSYASGNNSVIQQYGNHNDANVKMLSDNNNFFIYQEDDENTISIIQEKGYNTGMVHQFEGNQLYSHQAGKGNILKVKQQKNSSMKIDQIGNYNTVHGTGSSWAESISGSFLDLQQVGEYNDLQIQQFKTNSKIIQNGNRNTAVIIQK